MASPVPEQRGSRILPLVLDELAQQTPQRLYAKVLKDADLSHGFTDVTVAHVSNATHACAWWLSKTIGTSQDFETLVYVGINDLRYPVFWFAAIKCGYKVLFLSPRNTVQQNVSLIKQTHCTKFFHTSHHTGLAETLAQAIDTEQTISTYVVATFEEYSSARCDPFHYSKTFDEAKDDPIIVLHSSGSTGDPKPITNTNAFFAAADRPLPEVTNRQLGGIALLDYEGGGGYYSPFPGFHIAGITSLAFYPVMMRSAYTILGLPDRPPSIDMVHTILTQQRPRVLYLPPSIIEALSQIPSALELMKQAESVVFAGGPLARPVGDMLSYHVKLSSSYGSTEMGNIPCLLPERREDWEWLCWHPALNVDMEPASGPAYELVLNRDSDGEQYRAISNTILRDSSQYRSQDLFIPHQTRSDLWRFFGRVDDIIVLSNGEKWNPMPSEAIIQTHPKLSGVLVLGNGEFQPALLVEPKERVQKSSALVDEIWPLVDEANANAQRFGRIAKSKIAVVSPGSLVRATKGSVVRRLTLQKFQHLARQLYSDDQSTPTHIPDRASVALSKLEGLSREDYIRFVRSCVSACSALPEVQDDTDLYVKGFDSLETLELARLLRQGLLISFSREQLAFLGPQTIFQHPSIRELGNAIFLELKGMRETSGNQRQTMTQELDSCVERFITALKPTKKESVAGNPAQTALHIILTGSTGSFGQHLLRSLVLSPQVAKVTCLDRSLTAAQSKGWKTLGKLDPSVLSKVVYIQAELDQSTLGLSLADLKRLNDTDVIIHNAWKVNFNQGLSSFAPLLAGVANIANWVFCCEGRQPHIAFVSSVAAVANYKSSPIPEEVIHDSSVAATTGYGQSKQAAERVLAHVSRIGRIPVTILRVGQIAGSLRDLDDQIPWNKNEWVPILLRTSMSIGKLPSELPQPVDWVPSDILADSVVEVLSNVANVPKEGSIHVYNMINPSVTQWSHLAPTIRSFVTDQQQQQHRKQDGFGTVPYQSWFATIKQISQDLNKPVDSQSTKEHVELVEKFPAIQLIPFFQSLAEMSQATSETERSFSTDRVRKASKNLEHLGPIRAEWMVKWMKEWL